MRALILGATGMLGKDLVPAFAAHEVIGLGSRDVDLRNTQDILAAVRAAHADWIILSAAYADVDGCELNPDQAFAVNRDGAVHVARAAVESGARLLFISSDYVFDGEKTVPYETGDARNPINVYGRSKAEAECRLLEVVPACCIVRTSWLFGVGGKCFPDTILRAALTRPELRVVDDQRGCPTYTADLAVAVEKLTRESASGIVHATNRGSCSWFEFASAILAAESSNTTVTPVTSAEFPRPARRPRYSVLGSGSLQPYGIALPAWEDGLAAYLRKRRDGVA